MRLRAGAAAYHPGWGNDRTRRSSTPSCAPVADDEPALGACAARTGSSSTRNRASLSAAMPTNGLSRPTIREASPTSPRTGRRQRGSLGRLAELHLRADRRQRRRLVHRGQGPLPGRSTWHVASIYLLETDDPPGDHLLGGTVRIAGLAGRMGRAIPAGSPSLPEEARQIGAVRLEQGVEQGFGDGPVADERIAIRARERGTAVAR